MLNQIAAIHGTGVPPAPPETNSYESIATVLVGSGGQAAIDFTSIPSTYKHLQIRGIGRSLENNSGLDNPRMRFNGDTASNYNDHGLLGSGSAASANNAATSYIRIGFFPLLNDLANVYGTSVIDILDYTNTNKFTTTRLLSGADLNGSGYIGFQSGLWRNTNAITSISLYPSGGNWAQYSQFALYGIKG